MDKFDIRTAKLVGILLIILLFLIFSIGFISNVYQKRSGISIKESSKQEAVVEENSVAENSEEALNSEEATEEEIYEKSGTLYRDDSLFLDEETSGKKQFEELKSLDDESDLKQNSINGSDKLSKLLSDAAENQLNKNYESAIEAYKKAIELADDKFVKADCYESLADIFVQTKKYGSAMGYAQKAYNIKVTPKREFMLAKLYYKTGSTERALQKAEEIFKKDFAE